MPLAATQPQPPGPTSVIPAAPLFRPTREATNTLISALSDPSLSLLDLATQHNTTPEALSLWMTRPEIRERIESLDSITAWRTRLVANSQLNAVVKSLSIILDDFNARNSDRATDRASERSVSSPFASTSDTPHPTSDIARPTTSEFILRMRDQELVRKSAALLVRLTTTRPIRRTTPIQPVAPSASSTTSSQPAAPSALASSSSCSSSDSSSSSPSASSSSPPLSLESLLALIPELERIANEPTLGMSESASDSRGYQRDVTPNPTPTPQPPPTLSTSSARAVPSLVSLASDLLERKRLFANSKPQRPTPQHILAAAGRDHWP